MLDFAQLPPEINSALMYSGPWASAAPMAPSVAVALNGATAAGAVERATNAVGGAPMMPAGGVGRSAAAHLAAPRYGFNPTVIAQPPAGG